LSFNRDFAHCGHAFDMSNKYYLLTYLLTFLVKFSRSSDQYSRQTDRRRVKQALLGGGWIETLGNSAKSLDTSLCPTTNVRTGGFLN